MTANASRPKSNRLAMVGAVVAIGLVGAVFADYWVCKPAGIEARYVGRDTCLKCHQDQSDAFAGSHHDLAMDRATDQTVLGDFNDATLEHDGITSRMFRDGDRFMVHTEGDDGRMHDFEIKYVFGVEPLQQYMVEFDREPDMPDDAIARLQVLRISWDTTRKRWFYLRPPDVAEKLEPDDPLHWTGIAQRWQTMCADCHSTNLQRNFNVKTTRYHTTFSEIDVSCEACHGPGSLHVELANEKSLFWDRRYHYGLARLKGDDPEPQLQTCAPCHSRRGVLAPNFKPGDLYWDHYSLETLQESTYFADGQIKDEVYVYGSFLQSRMYHKGIRCTDCHDPHSLRLKQPDNATCTSCHQHAAGKYDVPSHHHHQPGTPGSKCVNCHMPSRTYMEVDPRRDHSLRIPRPDLSVTLGTPNACSGCHVEDRKTTLPPEVQSSLTEYADWMEAVEQGNERVTDLVKQTDQWCDQACDRWYGALRKRPPHFAEPLKAFRDYVHGRGGDARSARRLLQLAAESDEVAPAIARATALTDLANAGQLSGLSVAARLTRDFNEHPMVRAAAVGMFMGGPPDQVRDTLVPRLTDPRRWVRTEAARVLTLSPGVYAQLVPGQRQRVDKVLEEVHTSLMVASDRAGAHMAWASLCEARARYNEAIAAYADAIRVEPNVAGPRTNLAALLERLAEQSDPTQAAQLRQRATQLRADELPLLARDADLAPDNAPLQYRYGLALYLDGQLDQALKRLERAVELAPHIPDFRQARDLLREKMGIPNPPPRQPRVSPAPNTPAVGSGQGPKTGSTQQ